MSEETIDKSRTMSITRQVIGFAIGRVDVEEATTVRS